MNTNRVSATLLTADQEAVMTALGVIREKLPFLIDLTTAERVILPKLGDRTQPFVKKAVDIALQHPELLPAEFLDEMRKDAQLLESLSPIRLAIDLLKKQVDDTAVQVGAEAYAAARTVYAVTKTPYAKAILRTAADDLGKRFGRKSRTATAPAPPATVEPAPSAPAPAPGNHSA
ncbi:MAG TPA: hypothetical protein VE422_16690 [Terriglobia bacterium]|nr:hypothetical protein [Terriglobia bacterium]